MNPIRIDPDAFYREGDVVEALGLTESTVIRARKAGELRGVKRGHSTLYRGADLLAWLGADVTNNETLEAVQCA